MTASDTGCGYRNTYIGVDRVPHMECPQIVPNATTGARMIFVVLDEVFTEYYV